MLRFSAGGKVCETSKRWPCGIPHEQARTVEASERSKESDGILVNEILASSLRSMRVSPWEHCTSPPRTTSLLQGFFEALGNSTGEIGRYGLMFRV